MTDRQGRVFLIGAGPGDANLLTVRALQLLQHTADVVVYDRLVSAAVLGRVPPGVARVYVGKASGHHHATQDEINTTLVRLARSGHTVARLKGGDPFVFGRGGEEALALRAAGIDYEVVPGVTAASACCAYAGIPLTHRGLASQVTLLTGHCRADQPLDVDWPSLRDPALTLVVYMGLANAAPLQAGLLGAGRSGDTPVALIERGTTDRQRVVHTTLDRLVTSIDQACLHAPTLIVIGEVTRLAGELGWFTPGAAVEAAAEPDDALAM